MKKKEKNVYYNTLTKKGIQMKLKRCRSCGNMIAKDAYACPLCGGKQKKSHGCLLFFILIVLVFIGICTAGNRNSHPENNTSNQRQNREENKAQSAKKRSNDPFQVDTFSKQEATLFVQNFLENRLRSIVNITLKFPGVAKIQNLADVSPEIVEEFKRKQKESGEKIDPEKIWIVEQEFCDRDNQKERFSYYSLVEFAEGRGYRVLFLAVDGKQIFPAR